MDPFQFVTSGQRARKVSAELWNTMVEMAIAFRSSGRQGVSRPQGQPNPTRVLLKPNVDVSRFGVLGLSNPILTPDSDQPISYRDQPIFLGVTPTAAMQYPGRLAIVQEPAPHEGLIVEGILSGLSWGRVNVSDEGHTHARCVGAVNQWTSATSGPAQIEWAEEGAGLRWALLNLAPPEVYIYGELTDRLPLNGSGRLHATDPTTAWLYDFVEVDDEWNQIAGGHSGYLYHSMSSRDTAITAASDPDAELSHGAVLEHGIIGTDYAFGPVPFAIAGGGLRGAMPRIRVRKLRDGSYRYSFADFGGWDGDCP